MMTWQSLPVVSFCLLVCIWPTWSAGPTGCTLLDGLYECDYGSTSFPLSESDFSSPVAQRIRITNINTLSNTNLFQSNFASIDTAQFDSNWAPTLELKCAASTSSSTTLVQLYSTQFQYMSHITDMKIINCLNLVVNANAFSYFSVLDRLVVENGTISSLDTDALSGLDVAKLRDPSPSYPVSTGELVIMNSKVTNQTIPSTLLSSQNHMVRAVLEGMQLNTLDSALFSNCSSLRFLFLGYNEFTELPSGLLDGLDSLVELHLYDTQLGCACSKLWFFEHAQTTKLKIYGDITCLSPSNWMYYRASSYYNSKCVEKTSSCPKGIELMGACISYIELAMYCVCVVAFILAIVVLVLVICTKRQLGGASSTKGRGGPRGKKTTKTTKTTKTVSKTTKKGWA